MSQLPSEKKIHKQLTQLQREWLQRDRGHWFPYKGKEAVEYQTRYETITDILSGEDEYASEDTIRIAFEELSYWHHLYSRYLQLQTPAQDDDSRQQFILAAALGFLEAEYTHRRGDLYIGIYSVAFSLSLCALCGWHDKVERLAENMIVSINNPEFNSKKPYASSIYWGESWVFASWFILDLYCLANKTGYNLEQAKRPEAPFAPYDTVLNEWQTTDLARVDQLCYLLAERHLELLKSLEIRELWPHDVATWFYFRQQHGLSNPETLSHPLFAQPLANPLHSRTADWPDLSHLHLKEILTRHEQEFPDIGPVLDMIGEKSSLSHASKTEQ